MKSMPHPNMPRGRKKYHANGIADVVANLKQWDDWVPLDTNISLAKPFNGKLSHSNSPRQVDQITKYFRIVNYNNVSQSVTGNTLKENKEVLSSCSSHYKNIENTSVLAPNLIVEDLNEDIENIDDSAAYFFNDSQIKSKFMASNDVPSTPRSANRNRNLELSPSTAFSFLRIDSPGKLPRYQQKFEQHRSSTAVFKPNLSINQNNPNKSIVKSSIIKPSCNRKLTDYFPVRRSVRKTKKEVLEEKQRSIEEAVISGKEEGLKIQNFVGKGRGVVTTRPFSKGEFVVEYAGELITVAEAKIRESVYSQDQNIGCYMYYFKYKNENFCIDATAENGTLGRLVNHSRNGNLVTKTVCVKNRPHLIFLAKEDIPSGTEVLYDYGDRSKESLKHHPWLTT